MANSAPRRTGKTARRPPSDEVAIERARDLRVVEHVRLGMSFDEIAQLEGWADRSGPWRAFWRVVQRNEAQGVEQLRAVQGEQIEAQLTKWLPAMTGLDKGAAMIVLRIWERQARLWGLDAPARMIANVIDEIPEDPEERRAVILSLVEKIEASAADPG